MVSPRQPKLDLGADIPGLRNTLKAQEKILRGPSRIALPPDLHRKQPIISTGPKWIELANIRQQGAGPGEPPPGFVTPHTSRTEWIAYWALAQIFGEPRNPRTWPYLGGYPLWQYQVGLDGTQANAVVDFMINRPGSSRRLGIRIQTGYIHFGKGVEVIAYDQQQLSSLLRYIDVVDVIDTDLLGDDSGQRAIVTMKAAVGMIQSINPVAAGTVHRGG